MRGLVAAFVALSAILVSGPVPAREPGPPISAFRAKAGDIVNLVPMTTAFLDRTASLPDDARLAAFHARFDPVLPGYYDGKGDVQPKYDDFILQRMREFPAQRSKILAVATNFDRTLAQGQRRFRKLFPDYKLSLPIFLVHSMGQQDGGTRTVGGRKIMFFGADEIARIHDEQTIGPFLDHELFHIYHRAYFSNCEPLWCSLWGEGLAVYVTSRMNPGADDRQLAMTIPRPIRPEVDKRLSEAMCRLRAKFESTNEADYAPFFFGQVGKAEEGRFPPRYGYYLGYILAQKLGATMRLATLANLPPARVKPLLEKALADYGPCSAAA